MSEAANLVAKIRQAFAPRSLGAWPTPLEAAPALAGALGLRALWLKREDRSSARYGGNKVRGLEFLLDDVAPGTVCVTVGGTGSTHCLALTVHAAACGARAVLAQFPQPDTEWGRAVAAATERHAAAVFRAGSRAALGLALWRAWCR
ncbi:MAG TPA: pyridoxal-phosphate dependent enzyme, partial [Gemmatimonadales bacterium]|nr:pyridoxal-phosphate dependent enzyme [Gemmatimonadales bacterium]